MFLLNKLLIHPVDFDCNLSCGYCYNGSYNNFRENSEKVISTDILYKIFDEIPMVLNGNKIMVIWHGGEPLLAGKDFYREALKIQKEVSKNRFSIINCLQTNGTLIDEEWLEIFEKLEIAPSVSLDGPAEIHDKIRISSKKESSYSKVIKAYSLLRERNIKTGLLTVISKINVDKPVLIWQWIKEEKIKSIDFLPCFEPEKFRLNKVEYTISEEEIADFYIRIFDLWFDNKDPSIRIRTFKDIIKGLIGGKVNVCSWKGGCLNHVSLDIEGNIFPCGRYHCYPETSFGNIKTNSLVDIMEGVKTQTIQKSINDGQKRCLNCRWYNICHSGCPFLKYAINYTWDADYIHCYSRKKLFNHIQKRIFI